MSRSITSAFYTIFSGQVLSSVISILTLPLIVRVLGPGGYGDYAFLLSVFSILSIFISAGITEGVQKFVGEPREMAYWSEHVIGFYLKLAASFALVGAAAVVVTTWLGPVAQVLGDRFTTYFYLLAGFIVAAQFRAFARRTLMGFELERYSEPLRVLYLITWVAVGLGLGTVGLGVEGFLLGHILGSGIVAVIGLWLIARRVSIPNIFSGRPADFPRRELASFNVLNIALVLLIMSLYHVDVIMIRTLLGSEQTGYYKAALAVAEYIWFVPLSLQTLLLHSSSSLWTEERHDRINEIAARITRYTMLLTSLLALGIAVLADRFVPIYYGSDFTAVVTPLLFLLPGTVAFSVARPIYAISQGSGRLTILIKATGAAALINVVLNLLLIPQYGMVGAAVATAVGYGSMLFTHVWSARKLGFDPFGDLRAGRVALPVLLTAPVIYFVDSLIRTDLLALLVVPVVGLFVFLLVALLGGALDRNELLDVVSSFPGPLKSWTETLRS